MRATATYRTVAPFRYLGRPLFGQRSRKTRRTFHLWFLLTVLAAIALPHSVAAAPTQEFRDPHVRKDRNRKPDVQPSSARSEGEVRRVLIINDLDVVSSPGFSEVNQAVLTGLQKSPYRIEFYEESLELTLFPDRLSQDRFREEIIQKYSDRKPDVLIAAGPGSLEFIAKVYDKFQGTPIVFCAIWGGIPDQLRHGVPFTGVLAQLHPEGTLNAALHLLPSTKHVVVIGGMGKLDEGFEAIAKQSFRNYESKLEFTYVFDLTMPALLERLKQLPSDTIVYHTAITQDAAGDRFIDSAQSIPMVASAANAPVFVMDDVDLGQEQWGGDVSWAADGRIAEGWQ